MRILLDNCVPRTLAAALLGHEVTHCRAIGLHEFENGKLLKAAEEGGFDVLLTVDRGFQHQQSLAGRSLSLITVQGNGTTVPALMVHVPAILHALADLETNKETGRSIVIAPPTS
ncbi:MAG: DUF5615 family PIN-like protein [Armatimonadetes bacterium]|nr:DUF5615 family PIN-like protein [Armatimonadota bacterium]